MANSWANSWTNSWTQTSAGMPQATTRSWLAEAAFVALMLFVFVGFQPFTPPLIVAVFGGVSETAGGSAFRQICYFLVFCTILFTAIRYRGTDIFKVMPVMLMLLLAWCLLSASWAGVPDVALRRAILAVLIVFSALLSVDVVGAERSLQLWRYVLAGILVINWLSIPFIHAAIHPAAEFDPGLVGNWRGLYGHKNIAGSVCAITVLLFVFSGIEKRRWLDFAIAAAAVGFLVMTRSKSSMGFLPVALVAGLIYLVAWRRGLDRAIVCAVTAILLVAVAAFVLVDSDAIARTLENPAEFTGRAAIWSAELRYIGDHPLLGAGFGTFADTGGISPLHNYVSGSWVEAVSHGHNGYLQLFVTIGGVGFALAVVSLIISPLRRFWTLEPQGTLKALLFALFVFLVLHNFMESDFLEGDGVTWVTFLLLIGMLRAQPAGPDGVRQKVLTAPY